MLIALLFSVAFFQIDARQPKAVVHLYAPQTSIPASFGGEMLELIHSSPVLSLPASPPGADANGNRWSLDIKNLGPTPVTIKAKALPAVALAVGQTIHIVSDGAAYFLKR